MKYIIIGLGNYGAVLAEELTALGHEVIGADYRDDRVQDLKERIATAFVLDATHEDALGALPVKDVDVVIVAIGENFGASVRSVALLKQLGAQHIWARAIDKVHYAVLQAFNLDRILMPEEYAARHLVEELHLGSGVDSFQVDKEYCVVCFRIPAKWIDYNVNDLTLLEDYGVKLLGIKRKELLINAIGVSVFESHVHNELPEDVLMEANDALVCYARYKDFQRLMKEM